MNEETFHKLMLLHGFKKDGVFYSHPELHGVCFFVTSYGYVHELIRILHQFFTLKYVND